MGAALEVLVGPQAKGLSASTVSRLKQVWAQEYRSLERGAIGQRAMGVYVGRWCLQRAEGGTHEAVCVGGDRCE